METPLNLTSGLEEAASPDELKGKIEGLLGNTIPPGQAKDLATQLVETCGYDTPDALRDMDFEDLKQAITSVGHRKRVSRALFDGQVLTNASTPLAPVGAPAEMNVTVAAPKEKEYRIEWPKTCSPESILDWGLQVRAHLRRRDKPYSEIVWDRFTKPWTDVDPAFVHGSVHDEYLAECLLSQPLPEWAAPLVRNPLTQWQAVMAVQAVCRQVFLRTELSDKQLKRRVRDPDPEPTVGGVALRLATWDSDLSTCVDVRKFTVDDHDRKEALKQIVEGLAVFKPALEAFANQAGGFTVQQLRDRLGVVADEHKSKTAQRKKALAVIVPKPAGEERGGAGGGKQTSRERRAADAIAAVSKAMKKYPTPKPKPKTQRKKLCNFFRDNGSCRYGAQCHFSHGRGPDTASESDNRFSVLADMSDANEKDQLICAVTRFYDGKRGRLVELYSQVLEQAALTKLVTKTAMVSLIEDMEDACRLNNTGSGADTVAAPEIHHCTDCPQSESSESSLAYKKKIGRSRKSRWRAPRPHRHTRATPTPTPTPAPPPPQTQTQTQMDGGLWDWLGDADTPRGPLADTGASGSFIGPDDWSRAVNKQQSDPVLVYTGHGQTEVSDVGDLPNTGGLVRGAHHLKHSPETLLSVGDTCRLLGCGYVQDPGNTGARLWHPDYDRSTDVELVPDGCLFRLPALDHEISWVKDNRKHALRDMTAMIASAVPNWYQQHANQGHPFRADCDHCIRGRMRQRQAFRKKLEGAAELERGYTASADFTGSHSADIDGNPCDVGDVCTWVHR